MTDEHDIRANEALLPLRNLLADMMRGNVQPPPPEPEPPATLPPMERIEVTDSEAVAIFKPGSDHVLIENKHYVYKGAAQDSRGIYVLRGRPSITIRNCVIEGFHQNISIYPNANNERIGTVTLEDVAVLDAIGGTHAQGIYAAGVNSGVMRRVVVDNCASQPATVFSHGMYLASSCNEWGIEDSIVSRSSSHGIQMRGGGSVDGCALISNPINLSFGGSGEGARPGGVLADVESCLLIGGGDIAADKRGIGLWLENIRYGGITDTLWADGTGGAQQVMRVAAGSAGGIGVLKTATARNVVRGWGGGIAYEPGPTTGSDFSGFTTSTSTAKIQPTDYHGAFWAMLRNRQISGAAYAQWARETLATISSVPA